MLPRILPHVFRDAIAADAFEWLAMSFDKTAGKPQIIERVKGYRDALASFIETEEAAGRHHPDVASFTSVRREFVARTMAIRTRSNGVGQIPFQSSPYQQGFMPKIWIASPIQASGETNKVVGFPIVRSGLRSALKAQPFDQEITDPDLRMRVARRVERATLQPVSSFINALRERVSMAKRSGGRATRGASSFINGASFSPRVLVAILNIFRIYFNWFEARPYITGTTEGRDLVEVAPSTTFERVPGSAEVIAVEKRRKTRPVLRTPAMRHGIQTEARNEAGQLTMQSLHRVLYRPWIYAGTPLFDKLDDGRVDLRKNSGTPAPRTTAGVRKVRTREFVRSPGAGSGAGPPLP